MMLFGPRLHNGRPSIRALYILGAMANDQPGAGTAGAAWVAPLLERQQEVSVLGDLVGRASAGTAGIAVVQGEAGIGKSRLLAATRAEAARAGLWVLAARGSELEHAFPFGLTTLRVYAQGTQ